MGFSSICVGRDGSMYISVYASKKVEKISDNSVKVSLNNSSLFKVNTTNYTTKEIPVKNIFTENKLNIDYEDVGIDSDIEANKKYIEESIEKCKIISDLIIKKLNWLYDYKIENDKDNYILLKFRMAESAFILERMKNRTIENLLKDIYNLFINYCELKNYYFHCDIHLQTIENI